MGWQGAPLGEVLGCPCRGRLPYIADLGGHWCAPVPPPLTMGSPFVFICVRVTLPQRAVPRPPPHLPSEARSVSSSRLAFLSRVAAATRFCEATLLSHRLHAPHRRLPARPALFGTGLPACSPCLLRLGPSPSPAQSTNPSSFRPSVHARRLGRYVPFMRSYAATSFRAGCSGSEVLRLGTLHLAAPHPHPPVTTATSQANRPPLPASLLA